MGDGSQPTAASHDGDASLSEQLFSKDHQFLWYLQDIHCQFSIFLCFLLCYSLTGILRKSSGFGVFAKIFSKNIIFPSRESPFFGEAPQRFWVIITKFGCIRDRFFGSAE
jgi:hypothetical protein